MKRLKKEIVHLCGLVAIWSITSLFCNPAMAQNSHFGHDERKFEIPAGRGTNMTPQVLVMTDGKFGSPGWGQKLSLFLSKDATEPVYVDKIENSLHFIEYFPKLAKTVRVDGHDIIVISYLHGVDGNDPMELTVVYLAEKKAYVSKAVVVFNEDTEKNEVRPMKVVGSVPEYLQQTIKSEGDRVIANWKQESKRVEAEWEKKGFELPVGQMELSKPKK